MEISRLRRSAALAVGLGLAGVTAWAGTLTVRPGVPSVGGLARYTGSHGLEVNVAAPDRSAAFVQTNHPSADGTYRVRFYVNLRGLTMGEGDELDLFVAYSGADPTPPTTTGNALLRVVIRQSGGQKLLSAYARLDNGGEQQIPAAIPLVNGWRVVELDWAKATASGANNGRLGLWVDGVARNGLSGLDNDLATINYARWGTVSGVDPGTSGTLRLDDFASQRTGYMGPLSVFTDVPVDVYWPYIHGLYAAEITTGCGTGLYCPGSLVTRAEMGVFLIRGTRGPGFVPASPTGIFADVPTTFWAAPQIEQLYADGITTGCAANPRRFCPSDNVTRAEMAVFLLRAKHGAGYTPPAGTGTLFADVTTGHWAVNWIEQLYGEGITTGCAGNPLRYCPENPVTRLEMAIFLSRTFSFPLQQATP